MAIRLKGSIQGYGYGSAVMDPAVSIQIVCPSRSAVLDIECMNGHL